MTGIRFGFMAATLAALAALTPVTATQAAETCIEKSEARRYLCGEWHVLRDIDAMTDAESWTILTNLPDNGPADDWPTLGLVCSKGEPFLMVTPKGHLLPPYELVIRIDDAPAITLPHQGAPGRTASIAGNQAKALTSQMQAGQLARARLNTTAGLQTNAFELKGFAAALALTPCKP